MHSCRPLHIIFSSVAIAMISSVSNLGAAPVTFRNSMLHAIEETPDKTTGLDKIFVLYDTTNVDMVFEADIPTNIKVYQYGNLGGGYAEEVRDVEYESDCVVLHNVEGNKGYIFENGSTRYYCWVVNYLPYRFTLGEIQPSDDIDCDATVLNIGGNASPIQYFTINGQQRELSRDISVTYDTQEFDRTNKEYVIRSKKSTLSSYENVIRLSPPALCYTSFTIKGDRFLQAWRWGIEEESVVIAPTAVAVTTEAIQSDGSSIDASGSDDDSDSESEEVGSNQIKSDTSDLGGSAPADIEFFAYVTQGVLHYEWQMSRDSEFENIEYRFNVQNLDYTFLEEGTYYLRFVGSNSDGSCEAIGDTYTVSIGASELLCPNAFSPDGDGVNDEWKVSYRSLLEFDCWIFDRYGAEICHFSDPQLGWDGTRNGKLVSPGVYYYVITAVGSDGKKYKKSGDINILRPRSLSNTGSTDSE